MSYVAIIEFFLGFFVSFLLINVSEKKYGKLWCIKGIRDWLIGCLGFWIIVAAIKNIAGA